MLKKISRRVKAYFFHRSLSNLDRETRFSRIYEKKWWGNGAHSLSGSGSILPNTENIRKALPAYLKAKDVQTFLDAPCGDYSWMATVSLPSDVDYLGADIVPTLIKDLEKNYSSTNVSFCQLDIVDGKIPKVDVMMCRDCLFHLSEADIFEFLKNFVASETPILLTTFMPEVVQNKDISTGQYRPLNLTLPPFNFPAPRHQINDYVPPRLVKYLAEWSREDIIRALEGR